MRRRARALWSTRVIYTIPSIDFIILIINIDVMYFADTPLDQPQTWEPFEVDMLNFVIGTFGA